MSVKQTLTGLGLLAASSMAFANPIPLPPGDVLLSDNNAEELINAGGATDTTLDLGDRLRGIFSIDSIEAFGFPTNITPFGGNELTGIFDITVVSKTLAGGAPLPGQMSYNYVFAATGNLSTANAAVEMYYDPSGDYDRLTCATTALCEATAMNGSLWAAFSETFWTAFAFTDDMAVVGGISAPSNGGIFNSGLNFLVNNTGYEFLQKDCLGVTIDVCASGSLLGTGGIQTPYDTFSNVDFTLNRVPAPGVLSLMGLGLLGLVGIRRRKNRA